jgi:cytochrome c5
VQVAARGEAARGERQLVLEQVAAGVGERAQEDEPVAGLRVLEHVTRACHEASLPPAGAHRGGDRQAHGDDNQDCDQSIVHPPIVLTQPALR